VKQAGALTLATWNGTELFDLARIGAFDDTQASLNIFTNSKASKSITNGKIAPCASQIVCYNTRCVMPIRIRRQ